MKQPLASYLLFSSLGIVIWNALLTGLGYYFYPHRQTFFYYFNLYKKWVLIIGIPLLLLALFIRFPNKKQGAEHRQQ